MHETPRQDSGCPILDVAIIAQDFPRGNYLYLTGLGREVFNFITNHLWTLSHSFMRMSLVLGALIGY
jgi:hypothetical protein